MRPNQIPEVTPCGATSGILLVLYLVGMKLKYSILRPLQLQEHSHIYRNIVHPILTLIILCIYHIFIHDTVREFRAELIQRFMRFVTRRFYFNRRYLIMYLYSSTKCFFWFCRFPPNLKCHFAVFHQILTYRSKKRPLLVHHQDLEYWWEGIKNSQKQTCETDFPSAINELPTFFLLL